MPPIIWSSRPCPCLASHCPRSAMTYSWAATCWPIVVSFTKAPQTSSSWVTDQSSIMNAFDISDLVAERLRTQRPYLEFLRVPSMSLGIYSLPAGGVDAQKPHREDE